jgi:DNA repair exonuclease SbcCD ATPase subunit
MLVLLCALIQALAEPVKQDRDGHPAPGEEFHKRMTELSEKQRSLSKRRHSIAQRRREVHDDPEALKAVDAEEKEVQVELDALRAERRRIHDEMIGRDFPHGPLGASNDEWQQKYRELREKERALQEKHREIVQRRRTGESDPAIGEEEQKIQAELDVLRAERRKLFQGFARNAPSFPFKKTPEVPAA